MNEVVDKDRCTKTDRTKPWNPDIMCIRCYTGLGHEEQVPSILAQAVGFVKSAVRHITGGGRRVTEVVYQDRLAICTGCEHYKGNQCLKCGCIVAGGVIAKARWASESCPVGKWNKQE